VSNEDTYLQLYYLIEDIELRTPLRHDHDTVVMADRSQMDQILR